MHVSDEDRQELFQTVAGSLGERAARIMSAMFEEAEGEDPGIIARFDQQDAALAETDRRLGRVEEGMAEQSVRLGRLEERMTDVVAEVRGLGMQQEARFDAQLATFEGLLHREIGAAIASQTRTVLFGVLAVTAAMFGLLLAMNQVL